MSDSFCKQWLLQPRKLFNQLVPTVLLMLAATQTIPLVDAQLQVPNYENSPLPGLDDPVMAGYDLVAYHDLSPTDDGVPGNPDISHRHANGYLYYFSSQANREAFIADPERYLPKYGGFCAWGIAWEYPDDGWPWAANHMGPPCGPSDGWAILNGSLYCSIWRSYQNDFNRRQEEGIRLADARWVEFYGSLTAGPQNNGCYAWNWQECFARSIYVPNKVPQLPTTVDENAAAEEEQMMPDQSEQQEEEEQHEQQSSNIFSPPAEPLLILENGADSSETPEITWSTEREAMDGAITWKWTLDRISTTEPRIIVDLTATEIDSHGYVAFGVAETLMQGALVVCSDQASTTTPASAVQRSSATLSTCRTFLGDGMGIISPQTDPVVPTVLLEERNATHYTVRFEAFLYGFLPNPRLQARVLFARGIISPDGDPQPHINDGSNREAVTGIDFLSVVEGYEREENRPAIVDDVSATQPEPLIERSAWVSIPHASGDVSILDGRVHVAYELFQAENEEILLIQLQDVEFISEESYIGFAVSDAVMNGLVITCAPRLTNNGVVGDAICKQWNGFGTNIWPRDDYNGGWFVLDISGNDNQVNYTFAGRVSEVVQVSDANGNSDGLMSSLLSSSDVRAICAIGVAAPEAGTPLIHTPGNNVAFKLSGIEEAATTSAAAAMDDGELPSSSSGNLPFVPMAVPLFLWSILAIL